MARGLRRGPVLLRFRSLVDSVAYFVAGIVDARQLSIVGDALRDFYLSALAHNVALPVMLRSTGFSLWSKSPGSINAT